MNLPVFIVFLLGMVVECATLWDSAHRESEARRISSALAAELRPAQWVIGAAFVIAIALVGLIYLFNWQNVETSLDNFFIGMLFIAIGLFILGAGVIYDGLLPRVNEAAILSVLTLTVLATLASLLAGALQHHWFALLFGLILPGSVGVLLVAWWRAFHPIVKAIIYLSYLFALLFVVYLGGVADYFSQIELSLTDGFLLGVVFIFLLLHALFAIRFFIIVSSLVFPRNRPLVNLIMPRLFSDEQVSLTRAAIVILILTAIVLANAQFHLVDLPILLTVLNILSVQFLFQNWKSPTAV